MSERTHKLEGSGSLRKCVHCSHWFHNEADLGAEDETCEARRPFDEIVKAAGLKPPAHQEAP
jgi:hypothetical protein